MSNLVRAVAARLRLLARSARSGSYELAETITTRLLRAWSRLPVPGAVRKRAGALRVRPRRRSVPWDRILLGDQCGRRGDQFATEADRLMWSSTSISDSPHVALLELVRSGEIDTDDRDALLGTSYAELARTCIALYGSFFGADSEDEIHELLREVADGGPRRARPDRTSERGWASSAPRVRPIRHSDCYQVVDGHHRLARAYVDGAPEADVAVEWIGGYTALQRLLSQMSWLGDSHEIYQPLDAPELEKGWTLVRACQDRWAAISEFLDDHRLRPSTDDPMSSLDVAAAQGWFVSQFSRAGFDAEGVEIDPLAPQMAHGAYGLDRGSIHTADAVDFLLAADRRWDVVSCFSLAHHFALGRGSVTADRLIEMLDRVTGRVLFFETGQAHEAWFGNKLAEWTYDGTEERLRDNTTFDHIVRLGVDHDGVGPYSGNYRRMLYACVRGEPAPE